MANQNYSKIKLMTIFSTQISDLTTFGKWGSLKSSKAEGFVLVPDGNTYNVNTDNDATWIATAKTMIDNLPGKKVWVGTPSISSTNKGNVDRAKMLSRYQTIANALFSYSTNVVGMYYNQEAMYGAVADYNFANMAANKLVALMQDFSTWLHGQNKDLIWAPMYGIGTTEAPAGDQIKRNAYVANGLSIFDCVFLQPSYNEFPTEGLTNFPGIKYSMSYPNRICYREGTVACPTAGNCTIGAEYEFWYNSQTTFNQYTTNFNSYVGKAPLLFYWEQARSGAAIDETIAKMNGIF